MTSIHPPISTQAAIAKVQRDRVVAALVRWGLLGGLLAAVVWGLVTRQQMIGGAVMLGVMSLWMLASVRSMHCQRLVARVGALLELRRHDEAEKTLADVLSAFSLYRQPKRMALQNLAALRHAQHRFGDAGQIAARLLRDTATDPKTHRMFRLMLAECALELNDLPTAHSALSQIPPTDLPAGQMLKLLELQVDYCVRIGAWQQAIEQLPAKVELAELLPAGPAALVQAEMALAAMKVGRSDWARWLARRADLLVNRDVLLERRPMLAALYAALEGAPAQTQPALAEDDVSQT